MSNRKPPKNPNPHASAPYQVGYGKPPAGTQFQKGKSGNPSGRPKGSISVPDLIVKHLWKKALIQIDGKTAKVPKAELIIMQMVSGATKGNRHDRMDVLKMIADHPEMQPQTLADSEENLEKQKMIDEAMTIMHRLINGADQNIKPNPMNFDKHEDNARMFGQRTTEAATEKPTVEATKEAPEVIIPPPPKVSPEEQERRDGILRHAIFSSRPTEPFLTAWSEIDKARMAKYEKEVEALRASHDKVGTP